MVHFRQGGVGVSCVFSSECITPADLIPRPAPAIMRFDTSQFPFSIEGSSMPARPRSKSKSAKAVRHPAAKRAASAPKRSSAKPTKAAGKSKRTAKSRAGTPEEKLAGMSNAAVAAKTGRSWKDWVKALNAAGAAEMAHREIARLLHKIGVGDWWAQMVTVGYERLTGKRERFEKAGGRFTANISRTFDAPASKLFAAWTDEAERRRWLPDVEITIRKATANRSIRVNWPDDTRVVIMLYSKGRNKCVLTIEHEKLENAADVAKRKLFWKGRLDLIGIMARD